MVLQGIIYVINLHLVERDFLQVKRQGRPIRADSCAVINWPEDIKVAVLFFVHVEIDAALLQDDLIDDVLPL